MVSPIDSLKDRECKIAAALQVVILSEGVKKSAATPPESTET